MEVSPINSIAAMKLQTVGPKAKGHPKRECLEKKDGQGKLAVFMNTI
jgi:hypothetical protein